MSTTVTPVQQTRIAIRDGFGERVLVLSGPHFLLETWRDGLCVDVEKLNPDGDGESEQDVREKLAALDEAIQGLLHARGLPSSG